MIKLKPYPIKLALWWLLIASFPVLLCIHTWDSADTFMHLFYGQLQAKSSQFQPLSPMVMQHPDAVFYWLFRAVLLNVFEFGGVKAVTILFLAIWCGIWGLLIAAFKLWRRPLWTALWVWCAAVIFCYRITPRPEIVSYFFIALYLYWLEKRTEKNISSRAFMGEMASVAVVQAIWSGCHGYFFLGPALLGLAAVTSFLSSQRFAAKQLAGLAVVAIAASAISPAGVHVWTAVFKHATLLGELKSTIVEFQSAADWKLIDAIWILKIFWASWIVSAALVIWRIWQRRRPDFAILLAMVGLYLSAQSARSMPLFVLFTLPLWAGVINELPEPRLRRRFLSFGVGIGLLFLITDASLISGQFYRSLDMRKQFGFGLSAISHPTYMDGYFASHRFSGLILNQPEDGGYLGFKFPELKLYGDTQFTQTEATKEYIAAVNGSGFVDLDRRHKFDAVLVHVASGFPLVKNLLSSGQWRLAHGDLYRVLMVRNASPYSAELPFEKPNFFAADADLSKMSAAYPVALWSIVLLNLNDVESMRGLLDSQGDKSDWPTAALKNAGLLAQKSGASELMRSVVRLSSRRKSYSPQEEQDFKNFLEKHTSPLRDD
jgi:hypothetical protein